MFASANKMAREFTFPVVTSRRNLRGECSASIGSYVFLNDEGWIVTAYHLIAPLIQLSADVTAVRKHATDKAAIEANKTLQRKERSKELSKLGRLNPDQTQEFATWWGISGTTLTNIRAYPAADIAVGQLQPFEKGQIKSFPVFKDPSKNFDTGTSLCKLGFPFHHFTPTFDTASNAFTFPQGALPMPIFPIDGIFTRTVKYEAATGLNPAYPVLFVETSTPGLRGQSGGPTLDTNGAVWAIQSQTKHLALGFNPLVPGAKKGEMEHQFLNVGMGVHPETMFRLFNEAGLKYQVSSY